jgi:hypothetical protein
MLAGTQHAEAAYTAAYIWFHDVHDAERAYRTLEGVVEEGSAFEERGIALRVQALVELGQRDAAAASARRYLARFPDGGLRAYMTSIATVRRESGSGSPSAK